jgi:hypothetical protein
MEQGTYTEPEKACPNSRRRTPHTKEHVGSGGYRRLLPELRLLPACHTCFKLIKDLRNDLWQQNAGREETSNGSEAVGGWLLQS